MPILVKKSIFEVGGKHYIYLGFYGDKNLFLTLDKKIINIQDTSNLIPVSKKKFLNDILEEIELEDRYYFNKLIGDTR